MKTKTSETISSANTFMQNNTEHRRAQKQINANCIKRR